MRMAGQKYTRFLKSDIFNKILCLSGIAAPSILLLSILISGFLHPGYSHISQAISELGARGTPFKEIVNYAGLLPAGILIIAFSIAIFRQFEGKPALFICFCLVLVAGISRFFAGIFHCDPVCFPVVTISGRLHAISGFISLFTGSLAPLFMVLGLKRAASPSLFYESLILGMAALITFLVLISQLWMPYFGIIQRLLLILTYSWIILIAVKMITVND
jgi:hypothetical membrane protein